ncbi:hypothetical protein NC652_034954 [Populus alba x Populus x berolinensis]|uniref:Uncharacterized protein n=1 Tax=Populus alba x Populus x berolinensis TaxID=444605 RepID=A0AAD6LNN6_9ROSI|nr:hypothetical protein NC652_034954 [Populus alba x Populus x berolinensis]KAJ6970399.1 hypothetical protein NC653_034861 [Populus alba x Populus x berolinensis]
MAGRWKHRSDSGAPPPNVILAYPPKTTHHERCL